MKLGTVVVRGLLGPLLVGHGAQKLFGSFGGHGLDGTGGFFESLGLRPGRRHALGAGAAELGGGLLLTLGALTPVASAAISGSMVTAIRKVHGSKGPWVSDGGWEYNALILAALFAVTDHGPGTPSVDAALLPRLHGPGWAAAALGAGALGSWLVTEKLSEGGDEQATGQADVAGDPASARFTREPEGEPAEAARPESYPAASS
jgi:putative oxidoreductase